MRVTYVTGDVLTAAVVNDWLQRSTGDGMLSDLPMGGFKITGLGAPTAAGDAARKTETDAVQTNLDAKMHATTGHGHTAAAGDAPKIAASGLAAGAATDTVLGDRTVDPATATAYSLAGAVTQHLSWLTKSIKALKGVAGNWYDAASATIEGIWAKFHATTGHKHTGAAGDGPILPMYVSFYDVADTLLHSHDAEVSTDTSAYVKGKTIVIPVGGNFRVKFDLRTTSALSAAFGLIYKNGFGYGTERSTASTSYVTYSQDLLFGSGDTLELWIRTYAEGAAFACNLRLYAVPAAPQFVNS